MDSNPSLVDWGKLPETLRESNRNQARHIPAKLEAVGRRIEPLPAGRRRPPHSLPMKWS
jgi:hypothetical protein